MRAVGIRELETKLSEYIRLASAGEEIFVTDNGKVVAEIRKPAELPPIAKRYPGLWQQALEGKVRLGGPNDPSLYHAYPRLLPEGELARLLDEQRGER